MQDLAAAEPIAVDPSAVKQAFESGPDARFLDLGGRFTKEQRAAVQQKVSEVQARLGSKVWVLSLPGKTAVEPYAAIHGELKLKTRDVLLIFNADKRHLHSQALPKVVGTEILKVTNKEFYQSQSQGTLLTLDEVGKRMGPATAPSTSASGGKVPLKAPGGGNGVELILVLVVGAFIVWILIQQRRGADKRKQRAAARRSQS